MKFPGQKSKHLSKRVLPQQIRESTGDLDCIPEGVVVNPRTGGFEPVHNSSYFPREDDSTLQSQSVYTSPERAHHDCLASFRSETSTVKAVCRSEAFRSESSTVKAVCPSEASTSPVFIDDIKPQLDSFKRAVRKSWAGTDGKPLSPVQGKLREFASCIIPMSDRKHVRSSKLAPDDRENVLNCSLETQYEKASNLGSSRVLEKKREQEKGRENVSYCSLETQYEKASNLDPSRVLEKKREQEKERVIVSNLSNDSLETQYEITSILGPSRVLEKKREPEKVPIPKKGLIASKEVEETPPKLEKEKPKHVKKKSLSSSIQSTDGSVLYGEEFVEIIADDDDNWTVESELDLGSRVNMSDDTLMNRSSSPGALRLTEEGLQRHEEKTFQEVINEKPKNQFEAWNLKKKSQKWYREKHRVRDEELEDRTIRISERNSNRRTPEQNPFEDRSVAQESPPSKRGLVSAIKSKFGVEDFADVSLAPLNAMEHLTRNYIDTDAAAEKKTKGPAYKVFALFRRQKSPSLAAKELLEKERLAAREAQRKKQVMEMKEKERIDRKRKEYLLMQRTREAAAGQSFAFRIMDTALRDMDMDIIRKPSHDLSTMSSTRSAELPPCVVCRIGARTHIATPCMHFSFCEPCVSVLMKRPNLICPVCKTKDVEFSSVSV
jgi:hypothetical protein